MGLFEQEGDFEKQKDKIKGVKFIKSEGVLFSEEMSQNQVGYQTDSEENDEEEALTSGLSPAIKTKEDDHDHKLTPV